MCCRIFNTTTAHSLVTGRNMNWAFPVDVELYLTPKGETKSGVGDYLPDGICLDHNEPFLWQAKYNSAVSMLSGTNQAGYRQACADGFNDQGLAVNALADSDVQYGSVKPGEKLLSSLRWAQYIVDSFATVAEAVTALQQPDYRIFDEGMPDDSGDDALFHVCLSDRSGDSAIVEYQDGKPVIYHNSAYKVATNNPSYQAQLILNDYWLFQWGISGIENQHPIYTAPGGTSSTQMFEHASFNLNFCKPVSSEFLALSQTRNLMSSVASPINFNKKKFTKPEDNRTVYTTWINLAAHQQQRYYFINNLVGNSPYVEVSEQLTKCKKIKVMNRAIDDQEVFSQLNGNVEAQMVTTSQVPFAV